ncbi:MAG: hypothetical protein QXP82_00195 [Candidatus Aenigmatarchaeota archaeon]|nr:hypothetical protein [Candidatus Aenigmarchaeota archaeon]
MKFKFKSSWIGLFLIAVMLFSTFAYAIIQSFYPKQTVKLPESNIIDYRLDPNLADVLIQSGATLITFEYNMGCDNCVNQKAALEFFANEYKQTIATVGKTTLFSIYLEEIVDETLDKSKITILSIYGEDKFVGANETEIFKSLCKLMVSPPATCVLT